MFLEDYRMKRIEAELLEMERWHQNRTHHALILVFNERVPACCSELAPASTARKEKN
jgi:hypothetical protein